MQITHVLCQFAPTRKCLFKLQAGNKYSHAGTCISKLVKLDIFNTFVWDFNQIQTVVKIYLSGAWSRPKTTMISHLRLLLFHRKSGKLPSWLFRDKLKMLMLNCVLQCTKSSPFPMCVSISYDVY